MKKQKTTLLSNLRTGIEIKPPKVLVYGPSGVGKSTLASTCTKPIFLDFENRINHLDVTKTPVIKDVTTLNQYLKELLSMFENSTVKKREFQTVVVDTIDKMMEVIHDDICSEVNADHIDDSSCKALNYGRGHVWARKILRGILGKLSKMNEQYDVTIVVLGHSVIERYDNPMTESYDRYALSMNKNTAALFYDWADMIGYMDIKVLTKEQEETFNKKKVKAVGSNKRVLMLDPKPYLIAKNSYGLPGKWEVTNWRDLSTLIMKGITNVSRH